jgi:hypothetical protein
MTIIEIKDNIPERNVNYYLEDWVKRKIDEKIIPSLKQKDKDYLICVDGAERSGKSTLAMQIGRYIDPTLDLSRIVFSAEEFKAAIHRAQKGQVVIFDEAFTGLSSRASLSLVNKYLVSLMMQMGQKNLCVILVLPTFFLLDKYAAIFRSKILFHVYENKTRRGYFRVYNQRKKKQLWFLGKKDYSYKVRTKNRGNFYGKFALGDDSIEKKYREMKNKALGDTEKNPMTNQFIKYMEQRNHLLYIMKKETKLSSHKMEKLLKSYNFSMTYSQIRLICNKYIKNKSLTDEEINELEGLGEEVEEKDISKEDNEDLEE